ncbi:MAG TPA: hypothetical protein VJA21_29465 [Verrucomicrobiae bacterium]
MNPITLGILFLPVVAFPVRCRPVETKPADKRSEDSQDSMNIPATTLLFHPLPGGKAAKQLGYIVAR